MATQTLMQRKAKNMRITVDGTLNEGVTSKDVVMQPLMPLALVASSNLLGLSAVSPW